MRHQIWLATDKAYKAAIKALTAKQAALKRFNVEQPVDDFAHAEPLQQIGAVAKLNVNPQPWLQMLEKASGVYKGDPQIQGSDARLHFQVVTHYFMNSEGTVVRSGEGSYDMSVALTTQSADGMRLDRSHSDVVGSLKELPSEEKFINYASELAGTLKQLRNAPVVDEEYRGPVMFSADAASQLFADFVGENVLGVKPDLGQPARTRGEWATSYKSRVLPDFISVEDDPTVAEVKGQSLLGHYDIDDEGVRAQKVPLVEHGKLMNYVIGREPIRDFPKSNGHGRARLMAVGQGAGLGNLIVHTAEPLSREKLKQKLMDLCRQRELPYGYYVETMGPQRSPRLLFKVDAKDGHEELVRGAAFGDLDSRALRNDLIAAGDDVNVENRVLNVPHSIVNPSILFDELEVKRANTSKDKLPEYPAPTVSAGH
jgi:predicted Zn-dependent protease